MIDTSIFEGYKEGIPFSALRKQTKKTKKRSRSPSRKRKRTARKNEKKLGRT